MVDSENFCVIPYNHIILVSELSGRKKFEVLQFLFPSTRDPVIPGLTLYVYPVSVTALLRY